MSRIVLRTLLSTVLAICAGVALAAPVQQIDDDSALHRVEAVALIGSALQHTVVRSNGSTEVSLVPGTEDVFLDQDPALAIDPVRGTPVLAWSRETGSGFDIFVSRYDDNTWTPPVRVLQGTGDEVRPQIQVSDSLVHVVAYEGAGYVRMSLTRSLEPVFGPESLPTAVVPIVPGVDPAVSAPPGAHLFFASEVLHPDPTDPGQVVIWGVRDEPVPIDYVQALLLPVTLQGEGIASVSPIEGSLTVTVASPTRLWYTLFRQTSWEPFSAMELNATTTLSDARSMLADMIRRAGP